MKAKYPLIVNLIVEHENQVLMLYRKNTPAYNNLYALPAGKVEFGDSLKENVIREAKEEVGIDILADDLQLVLTMWANYTYEEEQIEDVGFFFKANTFKGEIFNAEPHKHDHLKWFSLDDLPQAIQPHAHAALKAYQQGLNYIEYVP